MIKKKYAKHLLLLLLAFLPISANAYDFKVNGISYNVLNSSSVEVTYNSTYYNSYSGTVEIPETVTYGGVTYNVTKIGTSTFRHCSGLTSIEIPSSVKTIGDGAFYYCYGLTSIEIPSSVKTIGNYAFSYCYRLTSIEIPSSVTTIGNYAFYNCSGLTSIEIPSSVTTIGNYAFYNCSGLTSIEIPSSVTTIGNYAFYNCSGLTSIEIPSSVTTIGDGAFYNCSGLTSIEIPSSVTTIGNYAFYYCYGLTSIEIPSSVTTIGNHAFRHCSGLTSIEIPSSVTTIGNYAFYSCSGLTSIEIPSSVTTIGNYAFSYCSGLTSIEIPSSVTTIGDYTFYSCSGLTSIEIPSSVTTIGNYAFSYCSGLTSIEIPSSVTTIGDYAFGYDLFSKLVILSTSISDYTSCFDGMDTSSIVYAYRSEVSSIQKYFDGTVYDIRSPYTISVSSTYLRGAKFTLDERACCYDAYTLSKITCNGEEVSSDSSGVYFISSLPITSSSTKRIINAVYLDTDGTEVTDTISFVQPSLSSLTTISASSKTQATITLTIKLPYDDSFSSSNILRIDSQRITVSCNKYGCSSCCAKTTIDRQNQMSVHPPYDD